MQIAQPSRVVYAACPVTGEPEIYDISFRNASRSAAFVFALANSLKQGGHGACSYPIPVRSGMRMEHGASSIESAASFRAFICQHPVSRIRSKDKEAPSGGDGQG